MGNLYTTAYLKEHLLFSYIERALTFFNFKYKLGNKHKNNNNISVRRF